MAQDLETKVKRCQKPTKEIPKQVYEDTLLACWEAFDKLPAGVSRAEPEVGGPTAEK